MSNLILNQNTVFIHIPKTGGSFIQAALNKCNLVTFRYREPHYGHLFLHQMPQEENLFRFAFIRHPYTWWPSYWNYSGMRQQEQDINKWIKDLGPEWLGSYTTIVKRYMGIDPAYECKIKLNAIGKLENVVEELPDILEQAHVKFKREYMQQVLSNPLEYGIEQHANKKEYNREINEESKQIIYNTEKWIFDTFNYDKG